MYKKLFALIKPLLKPLLLASLVITLVFSQADGALAARGGRIGGGSFRAAPSRTYAPPSRTYAPPGGGYYPGGGGFGFPFIIPFVGVGGGFGSLFTILIFLSIASFLVRSFRQVQGGEDGVGYSSSPAISVARVQVGLLANARTLQTDFDRIAKSADTGSSEGLAQVLQETTLSLMRHPEYWVYGAAENQQARLEAAEAQFNRLALAERSKFSEETLSNVNNQLRQASQSALVKAEPGGELVQAAPGEYIVVTLLVATQNKLQLPAVNNTQDLRRALSQVGAIPSEQLLAVEVLWTPQDENDTLSSEDLLTEYPDLKLI
jgi:uncharacterized membrane protein